MAKVVDIDYSKLSDVELFDICQNGGVKSEVFRVLYDRGMDIGEISKKCGSCYSFVYSRIKEFCLKRKEEVRTKKSSGSSKAALIKVMWDQGKTIGEISFELRTNYSYVWDVVDKYRNRE